MTPEQIERFVRRRESNHVKFVGGYPADVRAFGEYLIIAAVDHVGAPYLSIYLLSEVEADVREAVATRHDYEDVGDAWLAVQVADLVLRPGVWA